jgi:hypothetical protein
MNKLLLATALVIAFSLSAMAAGAKSQIQPKHHYLGSPSADQLKSEKTTRRKSDRREGQRSLLDAVRLPERLGLRKLTEPPATSLGAVWARSGPRRQKQKFVHRSAA